MLIFDGIIHTNFTIHVFVFYGRGASIDYIINTVAVAFLFYRRDGHLCFEHNFAYLFILYLIVSLYCIVNQTSSWIGYSFPYE